MVIGKITGYLALGLVGAFLLNALIRPQSALGTGAALTETGTGIASIGMGIGEIFKVNRVRFGKITGSPIFIKRPGL